jgi:hypothetical protein
VVAGRGGNGAEEGEGMWVLVPKFQGENECDVTMSNGMQTMMMKKTKYDVNTVHVHRIGINGS